MKNSIRIKRMVGIASLAAIVAVLQLIANYITIGNVSITLALTPLVIGAILYGPKGGAILGAIMGLIVLTAPSTSTFLSINPFATVVLCILKSSIAGCVAGFVFKWICKKNFHVAVVVAAIVAPIVNTGLFAIGMLLFFMPTLQAMAGSADGGVVLSTLFLTVIGFNFVIEFVVNIVLSPSMTYIVNVISNNYNLGQSFNSNFTNKGRDKIESV